MAYIPFYQFFPEIAERETRCLIVLNHPELPADSYGLIELYCDEPGCDCRRVFFNVLSRKTGKTLAVIAYGWENKRYYEKWMGDNDPESIGDLKGPILNRLSPQSKLAPALLKQVRDVLNDRDYVKRLKSHYQLFKEAIEKKTREKQTSRRAIDVVFSRKTKESGGVSKNSQAIDNNPQTPHKIGRNDSWPCGSGKKYKYCCLGK